jgi:hypothetical protein
VVTTAELGELLEVDIDAITTAGWLNQWSDTFALPPTRAAAPSLWED